MGSIATTINYKIKKMKNCNYCGAPLDDDALFCRKCGKEIGIGKKCPRCGNEERADSIFCAKCGMKLDPQKVPFMFPIQEEVQINEREKRKNRVPKKVINIVLAAVLLAFLYWIWQSGSSQSTPKMNFVIQNVDSTTFVSKETNNNGIGIDNTQRFGIHKVYLDDNGFDEQTVKIEPATSFSIKKDNHIVWAKYIIGNGEVTIKASANTTTNNRSCDFVLIDYNGNPVDTLEVIQAGKVSTTSGRNKSYMVSTASTSKATSTTSQKRTSTTTQRRTSTTSQRKTSTTTTTQRRASSTPQSSYRDQCAAITKKGTRCLRKASSGSIYCWQHQ